MGLALDLVLVFGGNYRALLLGVIVEGFLGLILFILIRLLPIIIRMLRLLWGFPFHFHIQNPANPQPIIRFSILRNPRPIPLQIIANLPRQSPKKEPLLPLNSLYNLIDNNIKNISDHLLYLMPLCQFLRFLEDQ